MAKKHSYGCLGKFLKGAGVVLLVVVLILVGLGVNQRIAISRVREQFPAPGKLVDVNGHLMHINCVGSGSPTVVIDAGNSSFSVEWTSIQEKVSKSTRVCTFDRAGYGWSEPGPEPRDGTQIVAELHTLLQASGETGPYVLVGHSLGGVHVRMFAAQYSDETVGLILVDTVYPLIVTPEFEMQMQSSVGFYQVMRLLTGSGVMRILGPLGGEDSMPEIARKLPADLQPPYLNLLLDPEQYKAAISEMTNISKTFTETSALLMGEQPFGDLPLVVLTAGQTSTMDSTPFAEQRVPVSPERIASQAELAEQSSRGEQRVIPESGHSVHLDAPEAIIQAILDILEMSRNSNSVHNQRSSPC